MSLHHQLSNIQILTNFSFSVFFPGIIAANALVFLCWRVPSLQRTMIRYFAADPASSECRPVTDELNVCRRLLTSRFNVSVFVVLQRRCALPCCSPPSATSLSSTWRPTCTSSGASPPAPSPCWAESSSWPSTCLQVRSGASAGW